MKKHPPEAGSALVYILVGIALFAALGFAVSRMNRGAVPATGVQTAQLRASEILQFARGMRTAVQAMQVNGISETQVSFDNPMIAGYANPGCAAESCKVFAATGGGLSYAPPQPAWLDAAQNANPGFGEWLFSGSNEVVGAGTDGNGDASADLVLLLPWLTKDLCKQINAMLGIANPSDSPPQDDAIADVSDKFTGAYTAVSVIGGGNAQIPRQRTGCFQDSGPAATAPYHFYQVLLAR